MTEPYPPLGSIGTGPLSTGAQRYPPRGRIGDGYVSGTPLSPEKPPAAYLDPSVTPEQKAAYNLQQQMKQAPKPDDDPLGWQRKFVKSMIPGMVGAAAGALVGGGIGGIPGFIAGMGANAVASGLTHYGQNRDPLLAVTEGGLNAVLHGAGAMRGVAHAGKIRQAPLKAEFGREMGEELDSRTKEAAYRAALPGYNEAQAKKVADTVKGVVKPWADVESSAAGISRMIGPDWKRVRDAYDQFLTDAIPSARGQKINISADAARDLKITPTGLIERSKATANPAEDLVIVDAGEALEATVGKSLKSPRAYHQVARALDEAGIGDPAVRAMYKNAISFKVFAERNRIVENGVYHPERTQKGIAGVQSRRAADIRQTDMDPVLRESTPLTPPTAPFFENPVTKIGTGSLVGEAAGRTGAHAMGLPWTAGHSVGKLVGKMIPGMPEYQTAFPDTVLGGPSRTGLPLTNPQSLMVNAEAAGIGLGARAAGAAVGTTEGWDYILEGLGLKASPKAADWESLTKGVRKSSPLNPEPAATTVREEEER